MNRPQKVFLSFMAVGVISSMLSTGAVAAPPKKSTTTVSLVTSLTTQVVDEVSTTGQKVVGTVSAGRTGDKAVVKYSSLVAGEWEAVAVQRVAVDAANLTTAEFFPLAAGEVCKVEVKLPGSKKFLPGAASQEIDCATGVPVPAV